MFNVYQVLLYNFKNVFTIQECRGADGIKNVKGNLLQGWHRKLVLKEISVTKILFSYFLFNKKFLFEKT